MLKVVPKVHTGVRLRLRGFEMLDSSRAGISKMNKSHFLHNTGSFIITFLSPTTDLTHTYRQQSSLGVLLKMFSISSVEL